MQQFSLLIPVYNEERRIPKTIDAIFAFVQSHPVISEVIFVNDGSTDTTEMVLKQYQSKYHFTLHSYSENRGKGYAIQYGATRATGDWLVFFDIDLATPLAEFDHLLSFMQPTDAVIIGSRRLSGSAIKKSESKIRTFLGQGFTKLSNILVPGVTDFTCGFKCFSRAARDVIFPRARIERWGFDTELLYIAHIHRLSIRQMPVTWAHDSDSKVNVVKAVISSFRELLQMLSNRWRGLYR